MLELLPFRPRICTPSFAAGDSFALMDAGVAGFEDAQNAQCATFYGAGCALYQDLFTDLTSLGAPPSPPPPPMPPLGDPWRTWPRSGPTRIFFSLGPSPNMQTSLCFRASRTPSRPCPTATVATCSLPTPTARAPRSSTRPTTR